MVDSVRGNPKELFPCVWEILWVNKHIFSGENVLASADTTLQSFQINFEY